MAPFFLSHHASRLLSMNLAYYLALWKKPVCSLLLFSSISGRPGIGARVGKNSGRSRQSCTWPTTLSEGDSGPTGPTSFTRVLGASSVTQPPTRMPLMQASQPPALPPRGVPMGRTSQKAQAVWSAPWPAPPPPLQMPWQLGLAIVSIADWGGGGRKVTHHCTVCTNMGTHSRVSEAPRPFSCTLEGRSRHSSPPPRGGAAQNISSSH